MQMLSASLEAAVVTLREGIEVALVVGVLLAYLKRSGRGAYGRIVLWGLAAAGLTSVAAALVLHAVGLDAEGGAFEGGLMFVAASLVGSLVVWMWRARRQIRRRLEHGLDGFVGREGAGVFSRRAAAGVFAFAFLTVLREGIETALFLTALSGTSAVRPLANALGGSAGVLLAILFGTLLVKGSLHVNISRFFAVTGIVLLVLVAKLVAGGLDEFIEAGILPASAFLEEVVELFSYRVVSAVILAWLILAPMACIAWDWYRKAPSAPALPQQPNGAHS